MTARIALDVSNVNPISPERFATAHPAPAVLICKATEGSSFRDATLTQHRKLAHKAGMLFGSYLFLRVDSTGNEATAYLRYAKPRPGELQPIIDAEDLSRGVAELARRANSCALGLEAHGYRPILYASSSVWVGMVAAVPALRRLALWEAQYPRRSLAWSPALLRLRARVRRGAHVCMWQFTDRYQVGGRGYDASYVFDPPKRLTIPHT